MLFSMFILEDNICLEKKADLRKYWMGILIILIIEVVNIGLRKKMRIEIV